MNPPAVRRVEITGAGEFADDCAVGDVANGAVIGAAVCSGSIYAANVGWISLGDGTPANGVRYGNNIATDCGVNHDGAGNLTGYAYGANIGWINARGDVANGAVTGEFICSGYIYSANCGWIHLGGGAPANGIRYMNATAADYGVNTQDYFANGVTCEAKLRGFAYGANIGWVNFEAGGDPRVNLATGKLLGYAWGANVGWIALSETGVNVITTSLAPGADTDADTIPDAWERINAGNLTLMNATTDSDKDGFLDKDEYAADTNPFNTNDRLLITAIVAPRQIGGVGPFVTDVTWTSKVTRKYSIEVSPDLFTAFGPVVTSIPPSGAATTLKQFNDANATKKFYRIRGKLPLAP